MSKLREIEKKRSFFFGCDGAAFIAELLEAAI